ncbi:adhesion G protein-coupled receptor G3-like isoform X2 [Heterodontus francisci]|uniref:adhesion G protein-coupled receptor G3-like isoform X2 n=1 Tax=Heterodontus francisci TaxID=7792 RepID=UPI00355AEF26
MAHAVDQLLRLLLWSYLFCCCLIQFNNVKVTCVEEFILCANLSKSTTEFQLTFGDESCLLEFIMTPPSVRIKVGEGWNKNVTITTKNSLMDVCFFWNGSVGKYLISPDNIENTTLPNLFEQRSFCCENFTLLPDFKKENKGNCSYLKGSNLTHIQFVNSSHVLFRGSSHSCSESSASRCEKKIRVLRETASTSDAGPKDMLILPFNIALFSSLFVDRILEDCQMGISDTFILHLESLLRNIYFIDQPLKTILTKNVKVQLIGTGENDFQGVKVISNSSWITENQTIEVINQSVQITVPSDVKTGITGRFNVAFTLCKTSTRLQVQNNRKILNDALIGITVGKQKVKLNNPVTITLTHAQQPEHSTKCVFLEFGANGTNHWNDSGCTTETNGTQTTCSCTHLTFFAVLLDLNRGESGVLDPRTEARLQSITLIGLGISIFFLVISIAYYVFSSKKTAKDFSSKIHINLCIALLLMDITFLLNLYLAQLYISSLCVVLAISLHYFVLSLFGWMGIEGFHLYLLIVKVFNTDIKWYLLKACLIAWGIPALIVCISYGANQEAYGNYTTGISSTFCWVTSDIVYYVTNVGIFSVVFLGNTIMVIIVSVKIIAMKRAELTQSGQGSNWKSVFSVLSLNCLLGLTYGLGFLSFGHQRIIMLYLFTLLNSLQGLFLFLRQLALITVARKADVKNSSTS